MEELQKIIKDRLRKLNTKQVDNLLSELRSYLAVAEELPRIISHQKPATVRKAQKALVSIEERLDRVSEIHHDTRIVLQVLAVTDAELRRALMQRDLLSEKPTKDQAAQMVTNAAPGLTRARLKWDLLEKTCASTKRRLLGAKGTLKLSFDLDQGTRWSRE